jgi:hypothetical protein
VKITLVDWSSVLELVSIVVDRVCTFPLSPRDLGDCVPRLSNTLTSQMPYKRRPSRLRALVSFS